MSAQKALSMIRLRNGDDVFLMAEYTLNSKLFVRIFNLKRNEVYIGHSNDIDLRNQAARIRTTFDEFVQKATEALFKSSSNNSNFLYCLDEHDGTYKFQWKYIDEEQTVISLGSVDVKKESFVKTLTDILLTISEEMRFMRTELQDLKTELDKSQNQTSDALKQLSLATDMKEKLEKEMYTKFVLVLNEKKRKITELQQKNKNNLHSSNSKLQKKKPRKSPKSLISDSSGDTTEFEDVDEPGPSNAKDRKDLLFLDENKPLFHSNQNRIRNRKIHNSKKETEDEAATFVNCSSSRKNITVDDESDELLLDNL